MLRALIREERPELLTTYTRNPNVLRMLQHVSQNIYPLNPDDTELHGYALQMDNATERDAVYHIDRYGADGLFGGDDPADQSFTANVSLKQQFPELYNARNALIVVARTRRTV